METSVLVEEISKLSPDERIAVIEQVLRTLKKNEAPPLSLAEAAQLMEHEYRTDAELTAFTALDAFRRNESSGELDESRR